MTSFAEIVPQLSALAIELPSWAFGNSGTRFRVFPQQGVPRDPFEKIEDAAQVHKLIGLAPSVALHIPWDKVDSFAKMKEHAEGLGVALGTINSNTFQDEEYMLGSLCHHDRKVRQPGDVEFRRGWRLDPGIGLTDQRGKPQTEKRERQSGCDLVRQKDLSEEGKD